MGDRRGHRRRCTFSGADRRRSPFLVNEVSGPCAEVLRLACGPRIPAGENLPSIGRRKSKRNWRLRDRPRLSRSHQRRAPRAASSCVRAAVAVKSVPGRGVLGIHSTPFLIAAREAGSWPGAPADIARRTAIATTLGRFLRNSRLVNAVYRVITHSSLTSYDLLTEGSPAGIRCSRARRRAPARGPDTSWKGKRTMPAAAIRLPRARVLRLARVHVHQRTNPAPHEE